MALTTFSGIITKNLTFCYDMNNTAKSWKGRPLTNQFAIPTPAANGDVTFSVQGTGIFKRVSAGEIYGGYRVTEDDVVYRYDLGLSGCHYHGNDVAISAGVTATWSCDYYIDPAATDYPTINYLANFEGVVGGAATDPTPSIRGVWKRFTFSSTAGSSGTCRMLLYPGACGGSYLASSGFILYRNPQVEFSAPGNIPSPFVAGTRSATQAVVDVAGGKTINANSLTYNSDGTFSFDGSNNFITAGSFPENYSQFTVSLWFNSSSVSNFRNPIDCNFNYNAVTGNIGPRLEQNSSGNLIWVISGNTGNNSISDGYNVISSGMQANTWYNVAITRSAAGTISTYLNGDVVVNNASNPNGFVNAFTNVVIGKGFHLDAAATRSFVGRIPTVMIYNRALNASEIKHNFNAHRGRYGI